MLYKTPVVKKRRNGRYGNNNWYSYSSKIQRNVDLYSDLEYYHWILIEFNLKVQTFCEQPEHIQEWINDQWINTIPDMWCIEDGHEIYIEIKPKNELNPEHMNYSERSAVQVEKQRKWCEANGFKYEVRTEDYIYANKLLLKNLRTMLPYIDNRRPVNEIIRFKIQSLVENEKRLLIGTIEAAFPEYSKSLVRDNIYNLIYIGAIHANISEVEIGEKVEVWSK